MAESVKYEVGLIEGRLEKIAAENWEVNNNGFLVFVENKTNIAAFNPRFWMYVREEE